MQPCTMNSLSDERIVHNVSISRSTLNEWKEKYSDISDALKKEKGVVDRQVENALLKRALGHGYRERTAKVVERDGDVIESERREFENRYSVGFLVYLA